MIEHFLSSDVLSALEIFVFICRQSVIQNSKFLRLKLIQQNKENEQIPRLISRNFNRRNVEKFVVVFFV